jgi:hypothetical protein
MMRILLSAILLAIASGGFAQSGVKPGSMYSAGDELNGPIYGVKSKVPVGWSGILPMDSEVFLLVPDGINADGEIYVIRPHSKN